MAADSLSSLFPAPPQRRQSQFLGIVMMLCVLITGCATSPEPLIWLQGPDQAIPDSATSFTTEVRPVPGQTDVLRLFEDESIRQMQALGYREVSKQADLTLRIELRPSGQITDLIEPVASGQFRLRMTSGERLLKFGETPHFSEVELDILSRERIARIVSRFLEGMPTR
ncbi:MAG: hypothetical protein R3280_14700 [Marinobacter sp.]|uniref:hypothetical protein n=1 Tax=Marinobacter sp. TaxID=50741 RepID=UPI00299E07AE|nr:hypothetical protein [Marinobacter sp.]MDX1635886.1 hypothetical protein [Marinobacter sp.]